VKFLLAGKGFSVKGSICRKGRTEAVLRDQVQSILSSTNKKQIKSFVDETVSKYQEMK